MKKLLALLLALLCVFSLFSASVSAAGIIDDKDKEACAYYITYQNETLSGIKLMYKPNPTVSFDGPGYVTVTNDTPIAVDHDFICWKDKEGKFYYEGDRVYVYGEITLYAVWEEKKDNDSNVTRVIKAALLTFQRFILKALGIFQIVQDFESSYFDESNTSAA